MQFLDEFEDQFRIVPALLVLKVLLSVLFDLRLVQQNVGYVFDVCIGHCISYMFLWVICSSNILEISLFLLLIFSFQFALEFLLSNLLSSNFFPIYFSIFFSLSSFTLKRSAPFKVLLIFLFRAYQNHLTALVFTTLLILFTVTVHQATRYYTTHTRVVNGPARSDPIPKILVRVRQESETDLKL